MGAKGAIARLTGAYDQYNDLLKDAAGQAQAGYQRYQQAGTRALNGLMDPAASFQASPDYQWRLNQGLGAVTQNKAAAGLLKSGSAAKALSNYGQAAASQEYGNWWQRQAGLAGMGYDATAASNQVGLGVAGQLGQNALGLASGVQGIKDANQARNDGMIGGALGLLSAFGGFNGFGQSPAPYGAGSVAGQGAATGAAGSVLSSLGSLWGSFGKVAAAGG